MKTRKHLVIAGAAPAEAGQFLSIVRAAQPYLDVAWSLAGEEDDIDLVLSDLSDFGGRCARIRALDEGRHLAVLADPGSDALDAQLVLHRPLSSKAIVDLLNHVARVAAPEPRRLIDFATMEPYVVRKDAETSERDDASGDSTRSTRACFLDIQRVRICTDLNALIKRGAVLLARPGIPPLLIDPITEMFHSTARMIELEPYFLDVVTGSERRRVGGTRLAALRNESPGRPLARLRWLHALLCSNGWLAPHLDPSATYRLKHWFQVDSNYRKQHRIALTLMREAQLHQIAASANAHMADVFDVVNAFDALGLIIATRQPRNKAEEEPVGKRHRPKKGKSRRLLAATAFTR